MANIILAIESSCDDTSAAICADGKILSNVIASQAIHEAYGGVVPELASRAHMQNLLPTVNAALKKAETELGKPLSFTDLNAVAFTQSPGLIGSLMVGCSYAKSLALTLNIPLIGVHHMQAHVLANLLSGPAPEFPFLCLTVSGGHTQIVLCHSPLKMEILGETIDDAAGEAFDKTAKLLGLPYPGGPLIDKYAQSGTPKFALAEPQIPELNFSFSGFKTSVMYFLQKQNKENPNFIGENLNDICASIQHHIINILMKKLVKAVKQTGIKNVCLAGGVSANSGLRNAFKAAGEKHRFNTFIPEFQYCTDNAGMIAITAYHQFLAEKFENLSVSPSARAEWGK